MILFTKALSRILLFKAAQASIDRIASHPREIAAALLASNDGENALYSRMGEVEQLSRSHLVLIWEPTWDDFIVAEKILEQLNLTPAPLPRAVMAAMVLAPAHHFPALPLRQIPRWLRRPYVRYLLGAPPMFFHAGEADRFAAHATYAMRTVHQAIFIDRLSDASELAATIAESLSHMVYFNEQNLSHYYRPRAEIIEWFLEQSGHQLRHLPRLSGRGRPKVGILHNAIKEGTETFYMLAHLRGRPKESMDVILYVLQETSSDLYSTTSAWVNDIVKLPDDIASAVHRMRADDLDLLLISNNITWGHSREMVIAAHRIARVQVVGGASPVSPCFTSFDLFLAGEMNDPASNAQDHYEERLIRLTGTVSYYAFLHDSAPRTFACSRADIGIGEDQIVFFSAANFFKIVPEVIGAWAEILARAPNSCLLLMPFGPNWGTDYPIDVFRRRVKSELLRAGVSPERLFIVSPLPTRADLHAVMGLADIYLDSFPFSGATSIVDPLQIGLPIVARNGKTFRSAIAASILRPTNLDDMLCCDVESYIERAVRLARDPSFRRSEGKRVRQAANPEPYCLQTEPYAYKFTDFCLRTVQAWTQRADTLRKRSPSELSSSITELASTLAETRNRNFCSLVDLEIITQLIVPYVQTLLGEGIVVGRMVDIGACMGGASLPFLAAGLGVDMFEPDPECRDRLAAICQQYKDRANHHALAIVGDDVGSVIFKKRSVGLSGIGDSPFASQEIHLAVPTTTLDRICTEASEDIHVIKIDAEGLDLKILERIDLAESAPKIVMIEFNTEFPEQSHDQICRTLTQMRNAGYAAAVFEMRKSEGFGSTNWACELANLALTIDELHSHGDSLGNIVFFRHDDTTFVTCLLLLLENYLTARHRSTEAFERISA
jgi:FkbM family methyltransferase